VKSTSGIHAIQSTRSAHTLRFVLVGIDIACPIVVNVVIVFSLKSELDVTTQVASDLFEFKTKRRSVLPAHEHFQRRNRANQGMT
jgi:hypothetical protein